jgi:hypothetical protein
MTAEIIFIVMAVIVVAIMRGGDLLFDHVYSPQRDDAAAPDKRDESEAA